MTIYQKRRNIWAFGIVFPLFLIAFSVFGSDDKGLRSIFFIFGGALFSAAVLWLMDENEKLESYRMAAITDPLTRLLNRQGKEKAFARLLSTEFREGHGPSASRQIEVSVIYIDVDHFKKLNDTAGHAAGDRAIITIADLIQSVFKRATDIVVREGGDEFVVILPHAGTRAARERAEILLAASRSSDEFHRIALQHEVRLTLSIGIASGTVETDKPWSHAQRVLETASDAADGSMYEVKRHGGNGIDVWGPTVIVGVDWPGLGEKSPGIMDRQE